MMTLRGWNALRWRRTACSMIFALTVLPLPACGSLNDVPAMQTHASGPVAEFRDHLRRNGAITFRSWSGKRRGTDTDTEIAFFPEHVVYMLEYGYTEKSYSGAYEIQSDGRISARFEHFPQPWPEMLVHRDEVSLLLRPVDANQGFIMGTRGGAFAPGNEYWPFRMLTGEAARGVISSIELYKLIEERGCDNYIRDKWRACLDEVFDELERRGAPYP